MILSVQIKEKKTGSDDMVKQRDRETENYRSGRRSVRTESSDLGDFIDTEREREREREESLVMEVREGREGENPIHTYHKLITPSIFTFIFSLLKNK